MPAGTIALTNNSTAVTGSGTSLTTELKANDFIVAVVGGVTYTLGVQSVNSATSVTLTTAYNGPNASGVAWTAVPNAALVGITAQVAADVAKAIRGLNMDKANWQQVYYGSGNITVTLPDGSQYTGPAWSTLSTSLAAKAGNGATSDITSLSGISGAIALKKGGSVSYENPSNSSQQLGFLSYDYTNGVLNIGNAFSEFKIKAYSRVDLRSTDAAVSNSANPGWVSLYAGSVMANAWVAGGTGGLIYGGAVRSSLQIGTGNARSATMQYYLNSGTDENILFTLLIGGTATNFRMNNAGYGIAPSGWTTASDERIKDNKEIIKDPLDKMKLIRGYTWIRKDIKASGIGFLAQQVQQVFPDSVMNLGSTTLKDGSVVEDTLAPDTTGVAAGLHHEAILALMDKLETLEEAVNVRDAAISELQERLKAIDGLDA